MLYETPGARSRDFDAQADAIPLKGLGAVTPHVANKRSSGGGGGYGVMSVGAGSGNSTGTPLVGSIGPGFRTVGRNTFSIKIGMKGKAEGVRGKYQASAIAARASTKGDDFVAPGNATGAAGLGSWFSHWTNPGTYLPPGGKLNRITPIPAAIRNIVPSFIRTPIRYTGAAVQSIFAPVLTGAQQRQVFGLSAKESGVFMKTQQIMRPIDLAIVTAGTAAYLTPGFVGVNALPAVTGAPELVPGSYAANSAASLSLGLTPIAPEAAAAPVFAPAATGVVDPIAGVLASTPVSGLPAATATNMAFDPLAGTLQGSTILPPAGMKLAAGVAADSGLLSTAADAGAFVGKTVVTTAAAGYLQSMLIPKPGIASQGQGGASPLDLGYQAPQAQPQGGGFMPTFSGGGSATPTDATPVEASLMSPAVLLGGAVVAVGAFMFLKRKKKA